jgi:DNA-binding response OmpR family regulator
MEMKKKVLVVDDEDDVRIFLTTALTEAGFDVVAARDGFEALAELKKEPADLVSLDLVMPRKSGVMFYREMMKRKEWRGIPVLIVTGHARDQLGKADLRELTMSGPGIYLEKPVKPENYIAAIKKLLGMETSEEESGRAHEVELQSELKNMIDASDLETLRKIKDMLRK